MISFEDNLLTTIRKFEEFIINGIKVIIFLIITFGKVGIGSYLQELSPKQKM